MVRSAALIGVCLAGLSACGGPDLPSGAPKDDGVPEVIQRLARGDLPLEDVDVCQAIEDSDAEEKLAVILDADRLLLDSEYSEQEDGLFQRCNVSTDGNEDGETELSVALILGTEFTGVDADDAVIYPGCRVGQKGADYDEVAAVRARCAPDLYIDVDPDFLRESAVRPWPDDADDSPSPAYVAVIRDVLTAVSKQGE